MQFPKIIFKFLLLFVCTLPAHAQDSLWVLAGRQSSAIDMLQTDTQGYWYVAGNFQNYLK